MYGSGVLDTGKFLFVDAAVGAESAAAAAAPTPTSAPHFLTCGVFGAAAAVPPPAVLQVNCASPADPGALYTTVLPGLPAAGVAPAAPAATEREEDTAAAAAAAVLVSCTPRADACAAVQAAVAAIIGVCVPPVVPLLNEVDWLADWATRALMSALEWLLLAGGAAGGGNGDADGWRRPPDAAGRRRKLGGKAPRPLKAGAGAGPATAPGGGGCPVCGAGGGCGRSNGRSRGGGVSLVTSASQLDLPAKLRLWLLAREGLPTVVPFLPYTADSRPPPPTTTVVVTVATGLGFFMAAVASILHSLEGWIRR